MTRGFWIQQCEELSSQTGAQELSLNTSPLVCMCAKERHDSGSGRRERPADNGCICVFLKGSDGLFRMQLYSLSNAASAMSVSHHMTTGPDVDPFNFFPLHILFFKAQYPWMFVGVSVHFLSKSLSPFFLTKNENKQVVREVVKKPLLDSRSNASTFVTVLNIDCL